MILKKNIKSGKTDCICKYTKSIENLDMVYGEKKDTSYHCLNPDKPVINMNKVYNIKSISQNPWVRL